jgi:hypothetical protein
VEGVFSMLDVGLNDRHECEGRYLYYTTGRWFLPTRPGQECPPEDVIVTYCPWCGEKLPETVIAPPEPTQAELRRWYKKIKRVNKKLDRWLREIEG